MTLFTSKFLKLNNYCKALHYYFCVVMLGGNESESNFAIMLQ